MANSNDYVLMSYEEDRELYLIPFAVFSKTQWECLAHNFIPRNFYALGDSEFMKNVEYNPTGDDPNDLDARIENLADLIEPYALNAGVIKNIVGVNIVRLIDFDINYEKSHTNVIVN